MFRRIVSNLSFSPALVGQLGFYAKRLRKEEATRRLGLIFTALALAVQALTVFSPTEATNAASPADFISGGISSKQELLAHYDNNTNRIAGLFTSIGITRSEVAHMQPGTITAGEVPGKYNWSRTSLYSAAQGQRSYTFNNGAGDVTFFYRPLSLTAANPPYKVLTGHSDQFGWFAIMMDCGNLITSKPPREINPEASCQSLTINQLSPTRFRFIGRANTKDGADIKGYDYDIRHGGSVIATKKFDSKQTSHDFVYETSDPGNYTVRLTVRTSEGAKTNQNCVDSFMVDQKPVAACVAVEANIINRTTVSLTGRASTANGATIKKYLFVVKNSNGKVVKQIPVTSDKKHVTADNFTLTQGSYTVALTVTSSVGDHSGPDCKQSFKIAPPEVCQYNPSLAPSHPDCQPCPGNPNIWIKDKDCDASIIMTKSSLNMTNGNVDASTVIARSSDKISYTIVTENKGLASKPVTMSENLGDVLEYATLIDKGGGTFDQTTKTLSWPAFTLAPGQKQSRTIAVQMLDVVPATNTGTSNADSYDCKMVNTFGNTVSVNVQCPPEKVVVEQVVSELPTTGPRENMLFAGILLAVVVYFYARSRQLGKEVRLIRRNLNTGTV